MEISLPKKGYENCGYFLTALDRTNYAYKRAYGTTHRCLILKKKKKTTTTTKNIKKKVITLAPAT